MKINDDLFIFIPFDYEHQIFFALAAFLPKMIGASLSYLFCLGS